VQVLRQQYLQPIKHVITERTIGFEVLSRFDAPTEVVFAEARSNGGLIDLDVECLTAAIGLLEVVPCEYFLTMNVTAEAASASRMTSTLMKVPPEQRERIHIELTEQSKAPRLQVYKALHNVRMAGAQYCIDDFGQGYSDLERVIQLGPDCVKIDKEFTHNLADREQNRARIRALAAATMELRITAIAEGIETLDDLEWIAGLGIFYAQGYYLGRPAPVEAWFGDATEVVAPHT